jgi:hypothetical protein
MQDVNDSMQALSTGETPSRGPGWVPLLYCSATKDCLNEPLPKCEACDELYCFKHSERCRNTLVCQDCKTSIPERNTTRARYKGESQFLLRCCDCVNKKMWSKWWLCSDCGLQVYKHNSTKACRGGETETTRTCYDCINKRWNDLPIFLPDHDGQYKEARCFLDLEGNTCSRFV